LNIGEKISLYKERLGFKNYAEFSKAAGLQSDWLLETSKKTEVKFIDISNLIKLSRYLNITVDQLIKDDIQLSDIQSVEVKHIVECDDIGIVIDELITLLDSENIKMYGSELPKQSKEIGKASLDVVKTLIKQYL
jgi:hypothetical protein